MYTPRLCDVVYNVKTTMYHIIIITLLIAYNAAPVWTAADRSRLLWTSARDTSPTRQSSPRRRTTRSMRPVYGGRSTRLLACARTLSSSVRAASHVVAESTPYHVILCIHNNILYFIHCINVEDKAHDPMNIIINCSHDCEILILCTYVFFCFVSIWTYTVYV